VKSSTLRLVLTGLALAATLWALVPSFKAYQLDQERFALVHKGDSVALARWDSVHGKNYREATRNFLAGPVKLGLDLQGGMYVTMEVDIAGLLFESAQREAIDEPFEKAIEATRTEAATSDQPVLDIFLRNFDKLARPQGRTLLNYYDIGSGTDVTEDAVIKKLGKNIEDAVDQAVEVIRQRIDKFGVSETTLQQVAGRRVVLELPGVTDAESVRGLLQTTARLEFKLVRNNGDAITLFKKIDGILAGKVIDTAATAKADTAKAARPDSTATAKVDSTKVDSTKTAKVDSAKADKKPIAKADSAKAPKDTAKPDSGKPAQAKGDTADTSDPYKGLTDEQKAERIRKDHPFSTIFDTYYKEKEDVQPQQAFGVYLSKDVPTTGEFDFYTTRDGIAKIKALLARHDVRNLIPEDVIIVFSAHPEFGAEAGTDKGVYGMYVVTSETELTGEYITDAAANFDPQSGKPMVLMGMNADGAEQWANITGKNIKKRIAIVLDSAVYSAPTVQNKIAGGSSSITGSKDIKEASLLAIILKSGALKAPIKIIEERIVGPSLGEDSIRQGITATSIAGLLVILFMLLYYSYGGLIADLAVMFNVLITLAALASFDATLTLPGIGGLVLTIGMAVDGNILIYERIREELAHGKALKSAVQLGYEKAFAAIIDTHITTLMTGAILFLFGTGPIKGFAITLMIGILATLFTAVFVTKTVFLMMLERGTTSINFGQAKNQAPPASAPARA
jgi:preprotein translocase subunit SecD